MSRFNPGARPRPFLRWLALLLCCAALIHPVASSAAAKKKPPASNGKKAASKVTFIGAPSSESPEARKKRLKIECRGRPNAGVCLGHTR